MLCCGVHRVLPWLIAYHPWIACCVNFLWVVCCVECLACMSPCVAELGHRNSNVQFHVCTNTMSSIARSLKLS